VLLSRSHAPAALLSGLINLKRRAAELFSHDRTLSLRNFLRNSRKQPFTTRAQNKLKDTKIQILNCKNPIASHVAKRERERERELKTNKRAVAVLSFPLRANWNCLQANAWNWNTGKSLPSKIVREREG